MYCSEICRDRDWSPAHKHQCDKQAVLTTLQPLKLDQPTAPARVSQIASAQSMAVNLISCIGVENIKKTALENKPMESMLGDPRTRGFKDEKFQEATLEALLSLEDNYDNLNSMDLQIFSNVSK